MAILELLMAIVMLPPGAPCRLGLILSISDCSRLVVPLRDHRVRTLESQPNTMATTAASTAAPSARRTHSPAPSDFFKKENTRPPASSATANELAAPAA